MAPRLFGDSSTVGVPARMDSFHILRCPDGASG